MVVENEYVYFFTTVFLSNFDNICLMQCWTEGRRSTAIAEDFRPTATATVAKV